MRKIAFAIATAAALQVIAAAPARADVIDGDWCSTDGKQMTIRGPEIVTPGGQKARGDYTRHSFAYTVPAGETGAGENVSMILRSEYRVDVRQGGPDAPWQEWRRCQARVS